MGGIWKYFSLHYNDPIIFVLSQWQVTREPNLLYLIYRWALWLLFFGTAVIEFRHIDYPKWPYYFIYFTNWGYLLDGIQAFLAAFMLTSYFIHFEIVIETLYQIYWFTNFLAVDSAIVITTLYWPLVVDENTLMNIMNHFLHTANSIIMVFELILVSHPTYNSHCIYTAIFVLLYSLFTYIYFKLGGKDIYGETTIYRILDWTRPDIAILLVISTVMYSIVVHLCMSFLANIRIFIFELLFAITSS